MSAIIDFHRFQHFLKEVGSFLIQLIKCLCWCFVAILFLTGALMGYLIITETSEAFKLTPRYCVYKYDVAGWLRIKDRYNNKWVTGRLTSVDRKYGKDSLIRIATTNLWDNDKLYGYWDIRSGEVAIEPIFNEAGVFSEGLACIAKGEQLGLIDTSGQFVIRFTERVGYIDDMAIENGFMIAQGKQTEQNYGWGVMNTKGEWVLEPKYDHIEKTSLGMYIVGTEFYEGLWSVEKGWIVEPKCFEITPYNIDEGFHIFCEDRSYVIDADGKIINPFVFNYWESLTYQNCGDNSESSRASDYVLFGLDEKCVGVYNIRTNKVILPAKYTSICMASKDVFIVEENLGLEYFVDKNGKIIKPINVNIN